MKTFVALSAALAFGALVLPATAADANFWEDDQIELFIIAGVADGTLQNGSPLTNLLASYPAALQVSATNRIEWRDDFARWKPTGLAAGTTEADTRQLLAWNASPWVGGAMRQFAFSNLNEQHVVRAIKLAFGDVPPAVKQLALANAGGRMSAIESLHLPTMNGRIKHFTHGKDAATALGELEQLKVAWALRVAQKSDEAPWAFNSPAALEALEVNDRPGLRLVMAHAYATDKKGITIAWSDFKADRLEYATKQDVKREIVSWALSSDGMPLPTKRKLARVHTCTLSNYEYMIILGPLDERWGMDLQDRSFGLEEALDDLAKHQAIAVLSRPGSPLLGIPAPMAQ
jgi:hypothetical protein